MVPNKEYSFLSLLHRPKISAKLGHKFKERNLLVNITLREVTKDVQPDPEIEKIVKNYEDKLVEHSKRVRLLQKNLIN